MAKTSRDSFKFMLRLPDDLRDELRAAAEGNGRSMTAEIIERLQLSFHPYADPEAVTNAYRSGQADAREESGFTEMDQDLLRQMVREVVKLSIGETVKAFNLKDYLVGEYVAAEQGLVAVQKPKPKPKSKRTGSGDPEPGQG